MKKIRGLPDWKHSKYKLDELAVGEGWELAKEPAGAAFSVARRLRSAMKQYMRHHPGTHFLVHTDKDADKVSIWRDR